MNLILSLIRAGSKKQSPAVRDACLTRLLQLLLLWAVPGAVQAQFTYRTNNGTIAITGYTGPGGVECVRDGCGVVQRGS